jgi:DNA-binding transcriptional LysR family regulator
MELRQLEYFVAVAEEGNFTRAATRVHVAQSGVSAQVRRLEREIGQDLFDRSGRKVRLTEIGKAVLPSARAALSAVGDMRLVSDELAGLVRGHVAVGMLPGRSSLGLPALLARFYREHPTVGITLTEANSDRLLDGLREREIDMAIVGLAAPPPIGIETKVVVDEPLVAAVSRTDDWATRTTVTLEALLGRSLITLPEGSGLRTSLDTACAAARVRPRIGFEASDPIMLAELAMHGLGVAILPESAAAWLSADLHSVRIIRPRLRGRIELAWRSTGPTSPAARALIQLAKTSLSYPALPAHEADIRT